MSGIRPLFTRPQSTSSPKHTQGGGHVPAWAPDPRSSPTNSRKNTANLTRLRGCGEEGIFSSTRAIAPQWAFLSIFGCSRSKVRNLQEKFNKSPCPPTPQKTNPFIHRLDVYIQSLPPAWIVSVRKKSKASLSNFPIPVWKVFGAVRFAASVGATRPVRDPHSAA